jgi:hypothetical protein
MFNAPIPGESLTREPKNAAYERPPEVNDPEDALIFYIDKLTDEQRMGSIILLLENGLDVRTITEGVLRKGVYEGIHSIDVSIMIAPAVHEYIKTTADMVGIEYTEGFETDEGDKKLAYQINETRARKALAKIKADPQDAADAIKESPEEMEDMGGMDDVGLGAEQPKPQGLMARRTV